MSHELARSFFTGQYRMAYRKRTDADKPWHDDSTKCIAWSQDPTLDQVIKDLEAYIEVVTRPIYDCKGDLIEEMREVWRPNCNLEGDALLDDNGSPIGQRLGLVGPKYTTIQDKQVVEWFKPWVDSGLVSIETGGAIFDGSKFWVLAKVKQNHQDVVAGDEVCQFILVVNGHDGSTSFKALPTHVRVVCNNTLTMAVSSSLTKNFKAKHNQLVHAKADRIRDEILGLQGIFDASMVKFKALAGADVKSEDDLKLYFQKVLKENPEEVDAAADVKKDGKRPFPTMMRLFDEGEGNDMAGVKGTWWAAFNAVTEFITHMRGRNSDARLDNMAMGLGVSLTDRALNLGLAAANGQLLQAN